ncbi:DUF3006 domain-containing protein [Deinococcus budaensis]|uniref:DUF3006 domain-containing protein n=1 Tax=Deinococcus budaensis TaxID=1665626 RepID=A0A7W8GI13_9DEIO|nr:DUF3006 domain-containing protein [Deinococcus budaensis]MBB5235531.1 hypothetical protein [Deinococcus budaensis]
MSREEQVAPDILASTLVVDAVEGGLARVEREDGHLEDWPLASLPRGVCEGDVIRLRVEGGDLEMEIDHELTRTRRRQAQAQLDALNSGGTAQEIDL